MSYIFNEELILTGIGSRDTPEAVENDIITICEKNDFLLRSGGARGADLFFENASKNKNKEIFLIKPRLYPKSSDIIVKDVEIVNKANYIASNLHPNWPALIKKGQSSVDLMTRNVFQILGKDLKTPTDIVIFWSVNVNKKEIAKLDENNRIITVPGGTGLAVSLAYKLGIPVLHLGIEEHLNLLKDNSIKDIGNYLYEKYKYNKEEVEEKLIKLHSELDSVFVKKSKWSRKR